MILRARNISKSFKFPREVVILSGISLEVERGESVAITGRSGEGKTTLLHILGTLEEPDSGIVEIGGESSPVFRLRNRQIGFIFQTHNLLEDFTALENVLMPARIARLPAEISYGLSLLDRVGLLERARFPAKLLSGGERQRVAIARALCNRPSLLLADEPSGNLDRANAEEIASLLFSLVEEEKMAFILVTHDPSLASRCSRRYLLSSGQLC